MEQSLAIRGDEIHTPEALWRRRLEFEQRYKTHDGEEAEYHVWHEAALVFTAGVVLKVTGLHARGVRNARRVTLNHVSLGFPGLPAALDGWRILHLSDFHFRRTDPEFANLVAGCVRGVEADVCLITGDYRFGHYGPGNHVYEQLARVLEGLRVRHGIYSVLGNHDISAFAERLPAMGVQVLVNRGVAIEEGGAVVWLGGVDDPRDFKCHSIEHAMLRAPRGAFRVLLAHTPELVNEAARHRIDVYLCGHTHGGQVRLPGLGALQSNAPGAPRRCLMGQWRVGAMQGYTSPGLGTSNLPVRYNCPPEATLITLKSENAAENARSSGRP